MEIRCADLAGKVSEMTGIDKKTVLDTYRAYWKCIGRMIGEMDLKGSDFSEDEFNKRKMSVMVTGIGKLCCSYKRYKAINNKIRDGIKEDQTVRHSCGCDSEEISSGL